jgi:glutamate 5-kinase
MPDSFRRLVVKVGSSLLIDADGALDRDWLSGLATDLAELRDGGRDLLVVSSGAIAIGSRILNINRRRARLEDLQAAAAAGQVQLALAWQEALGPHDITTAQVLLTPGDTEDRRRFLNARGTLQCLLEHAVVPVINENDTVATEEIRYGDNDRLAARVAQLVMADGLLLLSDVDGLYTADPGSHRDARHIPEVRGISDEVLAIAGATRSEIGRGGMHTKVLAARIATHAGCATLVADGKQRHPIRHLLKGGRCTVFHAAGTPSAARKQWLAGALAVAGSLTVDSGAARALRSGSSLLPVGVRKVGGEFRRGDIVTVLGEEGTEIGRGLAEYSSTEAGLIAGCRSAEIEERLGYRGRSVMLHRDDLVIFEHDG